MGLRTAGAFETDPVWRTAYQQLVSVDRVANERDAGWGLWHVLPDGDEEGLLWSVQQELTERLLDKLGRVPRTDVIVHGMRRSRPVGSTKLFGVLPQPATEMVDLTDWTADQLREWIEAHLGAQFRILVEVNTSAATELPGYIVEILLHELAAHAEPFADFLVAEDLMPGLGSLTTEAEQHRELFTGNPRYRLMGAEYVTRYPEDPHGPCFRKRMLMDDVANATLPSGL